MTQLSPDSAALAMYGLCSQLLHPDQTLSLQLEQRLVGGQANVIAALGGRAAQPCALPSSQQQNCNFALQKHGVNPSKDAW